LFLIKLFFLFTLPFGSLTSSGGSRTEPYAVTGTILDVVTVLSYIAEYKMSEFIEEVMEFKAQQD
jgi:hypothetical protein